MCRQAPCHPPTVGSVCLFFFFSLHLTGYYSGLQPLQMSLSWRGCFQSVQSYKCNQSSGNHGAQRADLWSSVVRNRLEMQQETMLVNYWRLKCSTVDAPGMSRQQWSDAGQWRPRSGQCWHHVVRNWAAAFAIERSQVLFFLLTHIFLVVLYFCLVADFWLNY